MFAPPVVKPKPRGGAPQRQVTLRLPAQRAARFLAGRNTQQSDAGPSTQEITPGPSWDFSKIPLSPPGATPPRSSGPPLPIQAKLKIGAVNDPLEQEADRIADQVMRMPELSI